MYDYLFEYFFWDYTDIAPILSIHNCLIQHPSWQIYSSESGSLEILCCDPVLLYEAVVVHYSVNANIEDFFEDDQLVEYEDLFRRLNIDPTSLNPSEYIELCSYLPAWSLFKE